MSSSDQKFSVAYFDGEGAAILVLDQKNDSVTKLYVPPETQVESAYNLGVIKIKNLEEVSQNERVGSILLSKTLTKNLQVPIPYYSGTNLNNYFEGSLLSSITDAIVAKDTNINLFQRINLSIFSSRIINSKRISSDISDYAFVSSDELTDGSNGLVMIRDTPAAIASLVSDTRFSSSNYTAKVTDATRDGKLIESVVQTIKNSGLVVTSIEDADIKSNCQIKSDNDELLDYYSSLFDCTTELGEVETDVELIFGSEFKSNF